MKKSVLFAISMFMVVALLAACAPKAVETPTTAPVQPTTAPAVPTEPPAPTIAAEVTLAIGFDPGDLAPYVPMSMGRIAVLRTIYEYLIDQSSMGGDWEPFIAKDVEVVDEKTIDVEIFDYVTDSAGNHITAADVVWSYTTAMELGNLRPLGDVESVTATGDYTVQFLFKRAMGVGDVEGILKEAPIVSQAAYEASDDAFATMPVTTSPYVLTEFVPGSSLIFEKRADYWQTDESLQPPLTQANVQKIVFQIIPEAAQHSIALETGTVDISAFVTGADIGRFEEGGESAEGFAVIKFLDNLTQMVEFNGAEGSPFTSKELRQAVAYAIDTTAMCQAIAPGACKPAHTLGNTNFGGYLEKWDSEPYYDYDLDKAKDLLAAAGYEPGELTVTLLGQTTGNWPLMAQVIQASLEELGITVELNLVESAVFQQERNDTTAFAMLLNAGAGGSYAFHPWALCYDQKRNNGTTRTFHKDDQLQELLETARSIEGFTPENLDAFVQYDREQVYHYAMCSFYNLVVAKEGITEVARDTRGQIIPGACEYAPDF